MAPESVGDFTRVLEDFLTKGKFSCRMGIRKRLVLKGKNNAGVAEYTGKNKCLIKKKPKKQINDVASFNQNVLNRKKKVLFRTPLWADCGN